MRQLPILVVLLSLTAFANGFQHNNVVCPIYKAYDPFVTPNATYTNPNNGPAHSLWAKILSLKFGYKFIYNNPQLLQQYADDYGHIVHEVPKAVFRPHSTDDVVEFVKIIKKLSHGNQKLQIVLRGASGNVEGAAQADTTEILVDFSCGMTDVQVNTNTKTVWAEVGALWEDVRASAFNVGLRPYIMPDYLGITIGGTASIGGLGPETPFYGSTADNILQLEVVTLDGKKITASPNENSLIFTAARGGMGNFFLITRVQYRLKDYVPNTRIFHVLTPHYQAAITDIIRFVKSNEIYLDGVQMFLSANDLTSFVISVGPQILDPSLAPYVDAVLATNQTWAYVMELTIRYSENSPLNVTDIQNALSPIHDKHLVFSTDYTTDVWDRRLYIFTIPALIQIGNWYKRHPWLNVFFSETSARNVLPSIINPMDIIKETGGGHVSLYPYPRSVFTSPFMAVPQDDDYVFLMVVGRDEITDTPQGLQYMENSNRYIWDTLKAAGHATLYPSNYIPHFNANDWKEHFGPRVWEEYKLVKKLLDPKFLLADERNFGFATSVY